MAIIALAILGALIFLLTGSGDLFAEYATLRTYLPDSAAMATSSAVRLNGILVGQIDSIRLTGSTDPAKVVEVVMKVQRKYLAQIPDDSVAGISAANLLGDKFINITKGKSRLPIKDGGTLAASAGSDIPELIATAGNLLGTLQITLRRLDGLLADIEAGRGNIGKFLRDDEFYTRLNSTAAEAEKLLLAIRTGKGTIGRLLNEDDLYEEIRSPIRRIDQVLAGIQEGQGTAGKLLKDDAVYNEIRETVAEIRKLADDLNAGKGTAGKLLKDEELYRRLNQVVAKIETTIDKVNTGQGTLGQLMVNPQLYESMNGATKELHLLMKDIRANPKKFLRLKLAIF